MAEVERLANKELPPHTRRREPAANHIDIFRGITSAYAEKRRRYLGGYSSGGNYLRIRGEEQKQPLTWEVDTELPPHTRRRGDVGTVNFQF